MHDTSTESLSKWRAVGAKRSESMILSTGTVSSTVQRQSKQYRPSKQREVSNSKLFNRNRSRIESSFDNLNKDDLNDSRSKNNDSRSKEIFNSKDKTDIAKNRPVIRINTLVKENENKVEVPASKTARGQNSSSIFVEKQLITLKNDYTKFKQKMLTQLQIQKHNITKLVNEILQSVKSQLLAIQEKYKSNSNTSLKREQSMPVFSNFNVVLSPSKVKQHEISMIKNISPGPISRNPTQKLLIQELKSRQNLQDPITERFSNFYLAIEKMKSQLNDLHQLSTNKSESPTKLNSPSGTKSTGINNGLQRFLKT